MSSGIIRKKLPDGSQFIAIIHADSNFSPYTAKRKRLSTYELERTIACPIEAEKYADALCNVLAARLPQKPSKRPAQRSPSARFQR